jgi:hypothetical protein
MAQRRRMGQYRKKLKCFSCGGDHYISNYPEYLEFKKMKDEEKHLRQP